jgi:hypothetical protein
MGLYPKFDGLSVCSNKDCIFLGIPPFSEKPISSDPNLTTLVMVDTRHVRRCLDLGSASKDQTYAFHLMPASKNHTNIYQHIKKQLKNTYTPAYTKKTSKYTAT